MISLEKELLTYALIAIAVIAFIAMLVFAVRLIIAKKEKRRQMKKSKIAVGVSAFLAPFMVFAAIALNTIFPNRTDCTPPIEKVPDLTGLSYSECKEQYSPYFELVVSEEEYSSEYSEGTIISHFPDCERYYIIGSTTIKCVVSKGKKSDNAE